MAQTENDTDFEALAELVKASFPDLRCLRCGHDQFYLMEDFAKPRRDHYRSLADLPLPGQPRERPALVTLACTRCGHVEQHVTTVLAGTPKPVPRD